MKEDSEYYLEYQKGFTPNIDDLVGNSWKVVMLDGNPFLVFLMNFLGDKKVFYKTKDKIEGYNVLAKFFKWGHFSFSIKKSPFSVKEVGEINYNHSKNIISKRFKDYISKIDSNKFIGVFCVSKKEKVYPRAYFYLEKIK